MGFGWIKVYEVMEYHVGNIMCSPLFKAMLLESDQGYELYVARTQIHSPQFIWCVAEVLKQKFKCLAI